MNLTNLQKDILKIMHPGTLYQSKELAKKLGLTSSSIATSLSWLRGKGLVESVHSDNSY